MHKLAILLPLLLTAALSAQDLYHVRVGTFQDVRAEDFQELHELGFVYGLPLEGQLTDVYLGNYSTESRAGEITDQLRNRGFRNATPYPIPADTAAATATYVQIALRGQGRMLDWAELERAGRLFVEATDGVTKVVAGPYPTADSASTALSNIRAMGFTDAFTRTIATRKLVPVGVFETGIKKPLIPIDLTRRIPRPEAPPAAAAPAGEEEVIEDSVTVTATATAPAPAPAPPVAAKAPETAGAGKVPLPAIDGQTKRHSAAELQRVLKEKGYYAGSIDGFYGPGTAAAYTAAWDELEDLRNFRYLAENRMPPPAATNTGPTAWPEMRVLSVVARELAAGMTNVDRDQELAADRTALLAATSRLSPAAAAEARNWEETTWNNLNEWATTDPLHARLLTALRVAYYQSQVRLEAMYQERGMGAIESRDLATAALRNLLAGDLDRFL